MVLFFQHFFPYFDPQGVFDCLLYIQLITGAPIVEQTVVVSSSLVWIVPIYLAVRILHDSIGHIRVLLLSCVVSGWCAAFRRFVNPRVAGVLPRPSLRVCLSRTLKCLLSYFPKLGFAGNGGPKETSRTQTHSENRTPNLPG